MYVHGRVHPTPRSRARARSRPRLPRPAPPRATPRRDGMASLTKAREITAELGYEGQLKFIDYIIDQHGKVTLRRVGSHSS